jgi:hypothetical protein
VRALAGEKATLVWDGLPARRSSKMLAWLRPQRQWLVVEFCPQPTHPTPALLVPHAT